VLDAATGTVVGEFNAANVAARLVVRDTRAVPGELGASQLGLLYVHVIAAQLGDIPKSLDHRLTMTSNNMTVAATAARLPVDLPTSLVLDPPLRGQRFIAGDGCCDSTRHRQLIGAPSAFSGDRWTVDVAVGRAALPAVEISRYPCRRVHQGFRPGDHRRQTDRDRVIGRTGRPRTRITAGPVDRRPAGLRVRVTILLDSQDNGRIATKLTSITASCIHLKKCLAKARGKTTNNPLIRTETTA
jgi:hypothetical protein